MPLVLPGEESGSDRPGARFERHHHLDAYAALVIEGGCDEAGDRGRFRAEVGDVLVHRPFDAHRNRIGPRGAVFINVRLGQALPGRFGSVADVDSIVRAFASDPAEAAALLREQFRPRAGRALDWPDLLADDLTGAGPFRLDDWAERRGLHPGSISRGFRAAYGISPKRFRLEQLASRAARRIRLGSEPLGAIAAAAGFADQAHMTRTIGQLFAVTPHRLRAAG